MKRGVVTFLTDEGIEPVALARAVEERGFDALLLTEHTHIPVSRESPWSGGAELPRKYARCYDPFVALSAMAVATERITLGTAVSLILQHDPIVLAKQVASVDRISGGRFELGIGMGWNREEMANHGVDPRTRVARMREHALAMRAIWTQDEAEFHGTFVDFGPIWSWPKPLGHVPVVVGGGGPTVLDRVVEYGDGWIPLRVSLSQLDAFAAQIAELRRRCAEAGRGHLPVTVYGAVPRPDALTSYEQAGVDRVIFDISDEPDVPAALDRLAAL
jgi:probable F420-dependent oxidoreductase